jgi:alpha-glucosidase (family GH31 glycosyl hydrolase)
VIRHRPHGRGHAYRVEPDQRDPVFPVADEPLSVGATTAPSTSHVRLELMRDGALETLPADRVVERQVSDASSLTDTHLAAAAAGQALDRVSWRVLLTGLTAGACLRYRFVETIGNLERPTRWHDVTVGEWIADGGELDIRLDTAASGTNPDLTARVDPASIRWLVADGVARRLRFSLRLEPDEHVVGFGERFNALDQRGRALDSVVYEQYKQQAARTYLPVPFAIVAGGNFGFHVATSRRVHFDIGESDPDRLRIEVDLEHAPGSPQVALDLFDGDPATVLARFLEHTGRPAMPPTWVFGPWMSSNEWNTQERVLAEVERGVREDVPCSVLVIEAWSDESTFVAFRDARYEVHPDGSPHALADFSFPDDGAWPDPKAMVETLHERGIRVLLWQIPLLKQPSGDMAQLRCDRKTLVERGFAVRQGDGRPYANRGFWFPRALMPDFTSEEARSWWLAKRRYLVEEIGVDGFKTDGGEHAWGGDLIYADGTRGSETNNLYPLLYANAYHDLLTTLGRPGVTFSRAGFTGAQSAPCHWAGDEDSTWDAFRASITAGLTAGASGIFFWGWDIAGFSGPPPSAELYLRATAMACFCPIMQYHSEFNHHRTPSNDRTPWNIAQLSSDDQVLEVYRRFARLRTRLMPYLEEQARRSVERGKPLMRALLFDFPSDPQIWSVPHQYKLGDDLLVAPVTEPGATSWNIYLPRGSWIDAWTGEQHAGPLELERPTPIDEIPVYIAARNEALFGVFADAK